MGIPPNFRERVWHGDGCRCSQFGPSSPSLEDVILPEDECENITEQHTNLNPGYLVHFVLE